MLWLVYGGSFLWSTLSCKMCERTEITVNFLHVSHNLHLTAPQKGNIWCLTWVRSVICVLQIMYVMDRVIAALVLCCLLDSFSQSPCTVVTPVQRDSLLPLQNGRDSHRSRDPTMPCDTRQSQPIFRVSNHKRVIPANRRSCLTSHRQSYCQQAGLVSSIWCMFVPHQKALCHKDS